MSINICPECGTENEEKFVYCKNCGKQLSYITEKKLFSNENTMDSSYTAEQNNGIQYQSIYENSQAEASNESISEISSEDYIVFLGKKGFNIFNIFRKMEISGSKISWCWPVAILGLIFGPLGASYWFFYRKQYKSAFILTGIGAFIALIVNIISLGVTPVDMETFENIIESGNYSEIVNFIANIDLQTLILTGIIQLINGMSRIVCCIICGLFGYHIYKNHTIKKIKNYKESTFDQRYYKFGLASIGGTSDGMVFLGIFITMIVSGFISAFISILAYF